MIKLDRTTHNTKDNKNVKIEKLEKRIYELEDSIDTITVQLDAAERKKINNGEQYDTEWYVNALWAKKKKARELARLQKELAQLKKRTKIYIYSGTFTGTPDECLERAIDSILDTDKNAKIISHDISSNNNVTIIYESVNDENTSS